VLLSDIFWPAANQLASAATILQGHHDELAGHLLNGPTKTGGVPV